ncbi:MAG: aminopeptidase, partial [Bacteroidetes bacterium]|nr:aminopeptidase [Bacteroidota bacterium]
MKYLMFLAAACLLACNAPKPTKMTVKNHSFSNYEEVKLKHLSLNLKVDFSKKELWGSATLQIENTAGASHIILDHKTLNVDHVAVDNK